ncbi:MAG: hypothetical protein DID91_2727702272 [Candidatus Nitrotoga sp. MKT]|nr:MAG: hypothetical protein DID91_2727702272 [Candidatus Nitrotoga sp. MKT]
MDSLTAHGADRLDKVGQKQLGFNEIRLVRETAQFIGL